jgi:hypothetical protein
LALCEGSMTRRGSVTSAEGKAALGREDGGDDVGWANANLTGSKMKKIHTVDSAVTNKWTVKI